MIQLETTELKNQKVSYRKIGQGSRKILFFHGFPGSSSQIRMFESSLQKHPIEVLCFDRPGYNQTTFQNQNMMQETLQIAKDLTEKLNWTQFEIVTVSGGTPYGISFAEKFSEKVSAVRVICGLGYIQDPEIKKHLNALQILSLNSLKYVPGFLLKKIITPKKNKNPNKRNQFFEYFYPTSTSDREVIQELQLGSQLNLTLQEAVLQKALGPKEDCKVFLSNWGQQLSEFKVPIHFWHGDQDLVISHEVSALMAQKIPHAQMSLVSGEGHLSLPIKKTSEILGFLFS